MALTNPQLSDSENPNQPPQPPGQTVPQQMGGQQPFGNVPQQPQQPNEDQQQPPVMDQEDQTENYTDYALSQANLAKKLKDRVDDEGKDILTEIGVAVVSGYEADEVSREDWMDKNKKWMDLALLVSQDKTWPWPKAANVKYPLIATAAMQFSARAYPALVPADGSVVSARVAAKDPDGSLSQAAECVARHMSWQVMERIPNWEEGMDKLLMVMAISGIAFKKTYYDAAEEVNRSQLVYPENFVVNYWAKTLEQAYRKTEILYYNTNEVRERQLNNEEFLDIELPDPSTTVLDDKRSKQPITTKTQPPRPDKSTPHIFLSQHTFWDLDGDGYEEPYVITVHKDTKKVVRIIARWDSDGVVRNEHNKIVRITPIEYFTAFPFIPNPDGSIYAMGFGMLLGSLNNAANTILNQLIDAGTMANLQSGFIGRNLRMKEGQLQIRPNEWKIVNASGEDLQKSIYPLPAKEPSGVLFQLLQMLITSGNQLASIAEIFVGKMPGQNTPATTTQETVQQGMAVFTAVYKRVYRSLSQEFLKIARLNRITPGLIEEESEICGVPLQQSYYDKTMKFIIPGGDPTGDSATVKMQKLSQVGQLLQLGTVNAQVYTERVLQANNIPNYQELQQQPPPPQPDPTEQAKQQTEQLKQQGMQQEQSAKAQNMQLDQQGKQQLLAAKQKVLEMEVANKAMDAEHKRQLSAIQSNHDKMSKQLDLVYQVMMNQQQVQHGAMKAAQEDARGQLEMARDRELHEQQMELAAKAAAQQRQTKAKGNE